MRLARISTPPRWCNGIAPQRRARVAGPRAAGDTSGAGAVLHGGGSVYSDPALYDAAFCRYSGRDFAAEAAFLLRESAATSPAFLELACGPGRHAHAAAALGARALGVDLSPSMVEYARALEPRSAARFAVGDMSRLADCADVAAGAPFDVITCLFSSFTHLVAEGAALACLRGAAAHLTRGGVIVLDLEHPRRLFDGSGRRGDGSDDWHVPTWDTFCEDGRALAVRWGAPGDAFDPLTQTLHRTVAMDVYTRGAPEPALAVRDVVPTRFFGVPELRLLAAAAGLRVVSELGALREEGVALADARATRLVLLLARQDDV